MSFRESAHGPFARNQWGWRIYHLWAASRAEGDAMIVWLRVNATGKWNLGVGDGLVREIAFESESDAIACKSYISRVADYDFAVYQVQVIDDDGFYRDCRQLKESGFTFNIFETERHRYLKCWGQPAATYARLLIPSLRLLTK